MYVKKDTVFLEWASFYVGNLSSDNSDESIIYVPLDGNSKDDMDLLEVFFVSSTIELGELSNEYDYLLSDAIIEKKTIVTNKKKIDYEEWNTLFVGEEKVSISIRKITDRFLVIEIEKFF